MTNNTAEPVFAHLVPAQGGDAGSRGILVPKGEVRQIHFVEWDVPDTAVQVLRMDGTPLSFTPLLKKRDYDIAVTEGGHQDIGSFVQPTPTTAKLPPELASLDLLGPAEGVSAITCRDGNKEVRQQYVTLTEVTNQSSESLLIDGFEPDLSYEDEGPKSVTLALPGESVRLLLIAIEQPWVVAYDSSGTRRFTARVPLEERTFVTIPPTLPERSAPVPLLDFTRRSRGGGCDWIPFVDVNRSSMARVGIFLLAAALFTIVVMGGQWLYKRVRTS